MVSYHAHNGPVKFLVMAAATVRTDKDKPTDSPPPGAEASEEEQKEAPPGEGPGPSQSAADGIWLGGSLGSGTHRSDFSSPSGSLTASQGSGSLESRSEESVVYDLLRLPSILPSRGRRARRAKASSVLVACGGQGHRRVSRKARQQRPEELASSVMVWQIPLLSA